MEEAGARGGLPAAVQPPSEPGGERLAAGEGVFDAPAALRERRGAEEGGGRGHGEAQSAGGAGGVAKFMRGYLVEGLLRRHLPVKRLALAEIHGVKRSKVVQLEPFSQILR